MEKKYQIFISSTFVDLKEERQAVSSAILDLGHIPSGMELFPASNSSQMDYIKKVIDDCDYYLIVIGGKYGSIGPDGISYTEAEYNYAIQKELPILAFMHNNTENLISKHTERDPELRKRLDAFKEKVRSNRIVKFWGDIGSLQSSVITALTTEFSTNPRIGWRRDDGQLSRTTLEKLDSLKKEVERFRSLWRETLNKVRSYENLAESQAEIKFHSDGVLRKINVTGEQLIREFAPLLNRQLSQEEIRHGLTSIISHSTELIENQITLSESSINTIELFFEVFEIAEKDEFDLLSLRPDKKFLLKAAFKPLKIVLLDEEIPF